MNCTGKSEPDPPPPAKLTEVIFCTGRLLYFSHMDKMILWALLPFVFGTVAAQSNRHFFDSRTTTAAPHAVWKLWTDVPNWHVWDTGLQSATIDGPFQMGQTGTLVSDKGRKVRFTVIEYEENRAYAFAMKLPLGKMTIRRELKTGSGTEFRHEVLFSGFSGGLFGRLLGRDYREMLPKVTQEVARLAEGKG